MTFREFVALDEFKLKPVKFKPNMQIPPLVFRKSGPEKMNPLGVVSPSRPFVFSMAKGQPKSGIIGKKH